MLIYPQFNQASILVVGDVMLDRYWFGDAARISPEAPVAVVNVKQTDERPGGAGNVALNIASLGAKVRLIGVAGCDEAGEILKKLLNENNVENNIQQCQSIPTITKLRVLSQHQQLLRLDFEEKIPSFDKDDFIQIFKRNLAGVNLVIFSDYNKGTLVGVQELIQIAKAKNVAVLVDPKGSDFSIYAHADLITPNFKEFESIVGKCPDESTIVSKAKTFLKNLNIGTLLLTRGEKGMTLIRQNAEDIHVPAHAREVFDVTGAGDTVIAVFGAAYASGASLKDAMIIGNLAASLVVAKLGAATVTSHELEIAFNQHATFSGIVNETELMAAVTQARLQNKKIVFTNGCFDILHAGHATYLQQAKKLGDYLVVAINSDTSVKKLNKGPGRPINNFEARASVLASLSAVDWVIGFDDDTPERLLKKFQPDILVKGGDYNIDQVVGAEVVYAYGGEVRVLGIVKNISTTRIIEKMVQTTHLQEESL